MVAIAESTGRNLSAVKQLYDDLGDLGLVAQNSRATQRTMFPVPPLTIEGVFKTLKDIGSLSGQSVTYPKLFY